MVSAPSLMPHLLIMLTAKQVCPDIVKSFKGSLCLIDIDQKTTYELVHEISNNVAFATSKASDQPAHKRSLIRAFASHLSIL